MIGLIFVPAGWLKKLAPIIFVGSLVGLAAVRMPGVGVSANGAARWRRAGMIKLGDNALSDVRTFGATFAREIRHEAGDALTFKDA